MKRVIVLGGGVAGLTAAHTGRCGKEARHCSRGEIIAEVWNQLRESLNGPNGAILRDDDVQSVFVCPSLRLESSSGPAAYAEPLFVNTAGSLALRPSPATALANLFLAGDYVRSGVELACMEGANETARIAVNELLKRSRAEAPRCEVCRSRSRRSSGRCEVSIASRSAWAYRGSSEPERVPRTRRSPRPRAADSLRARRGTPRGRAPPPR